MISTSDLDFGSWPGLAGLAAADRLDPASRSGGDDAPTVAAGVPSDVPSASANTLVSGTFRDARFSADGTQLYASSGNAVDIIDVATGAVVQSYDFGRAVGAIDLSADGRYLAATFYPNVQQTSATFFRIDLTTGTVETHSFATTAGDPKSLITNDFMDIVQLSGNRYLATQQTTGGLIQIDLSGATPAISRVTATGSSAFLEASPDHTHAMVLSPSLYTYVDGTGITASIGYDPYAGASVRPGPAPFGASSAAYSPNSDVLLLDGQVYNNTLTKQPAIQAQIHVPINQAVFSADGSRLYALDDNVVTVIDTSNWQALAVYPVGASAIPDTKVVGNVLAYSGFGDTLELSGDGHHLSVLTVAGIELIDLQNAVSIATPGTDDLRGLSVQIGLGGNDLLGGTGGVALYGGAGDDQYTIVDGNGRIVEYANEGIDTALVGIASYILPQFVENGTVTLAGGATLQGNDLDNLLTGSDAADNLYGAGGNDTINGGAGADIINGASGDDVLNGGIGADQIIGEDGNDVIHGGDDADTINGGTGTDQIWGDAGNDVISGGTGADILNGGDGDDTIASDTVGTGYAGDDTGSEVDVVNAGAGNDLVSIGYGDSADGGDGFDTLNLSLAAAPAGVTLDTADLNGKTFSIGGGTVISFERLARLRGSEFADHITVSGLSQPITIMGGGGDDVVYATGSQITFDGGSGSDTIDYGHYSTGVTVSYSGGSGTGPGGDTFTSVENVVGSAFDDVITGSFTGTLSGGAGNDFLSSTTYGSSLYGGTGDDTYLVYGPGTNIVEAANEGVDTIRTYSNYTVIPNNVENVVSLGTAGAYVLGNSLSNTITGGVGNDYLVGNGGIDSLLGGNGDDYLVVGTGGDGTTVDGGTGYDTLLVTGSVSLGGLTGVEAIELQNAATLTLTGAQFNTFAPGSTLSGDGSITVDMAPGDLRLNAQFLTIVLDANVAFTINGSSDSESIKGSIGAVNTIDGGDGSDLIRGGSLGDSIVGGAGDDKIIGARGADILTGGDGADTFRYQSVDASGLGAAADRITDFVSGIDHLGFRGFDADPNTPQMDTFSYIDTQAFHATGAAEIRYETAGADLVVQVDVNGDGVADMAIYLQGLGGTTLHPGDFLI